MVISLASSSTSRRKVPSGVRMRMSIATMVMTVAVTIAVTVMMAGTVMDVTLLPAWAAG